jgi:hypothetical protein
MPLTSFASLPPSARIWVFASDIPLVGAPADHLLTQVDAYLESWRAHGVPLQCARQWLDDRFLIVGIDPTEEQASGCSIDGLFRAVQGIERALGTRLIGGGRVFYRDAAGRPAVASRDEFQALVERNIVSAETSVFNTALTQLDEWRASFEQPLTRSWAASIIRQPVD